MARHPSITDVRLTFGRLYLIPTDEDVLVEELHKLHEHEVLHSFHIEATLTAKGHSSSFLLNVVEYIRDTLFATQDIGRGTEFFLRMSDEFAIVGEPLKEGGIDWSMSFKDQVHVGSSEQVLLMLYTNYAALIAACVSQGVDIDAVYRSCRGYLGLA